MNAGAPPDPTALHRLQATLAEGMAAGGLTAAPPANGSAPSPDSSAASDSGPSRKRSRKDSTASILAASLAISINNPYESPASASSLPLPAVPSPALHPIPAGNPSNSLSLLADASLAAEIDGRTQLTGLDPTFTLSSVTSAIQAKNDQIESEEKAPGLLSKGIVDAETAVELFRLYVAQTRLMRKN